MIVYSATKYCLGFWVELGVASFIYADLELSSYEFLQNSFVLKGDVEKWRNSFLVFFHVCDLLF